jgi:hypothetical protein
MKENIIKVILDTLAPNGNFEHKRLASLSAFWVAVMFAIFKINNEIVFAFLAYSATAIGMNVWNKKIDKE